MVRSTGNLSSNNITSIALRSSGTRAQKRNKTVNHIQEPGTYRGHTGVIKGSYRGHTGVIQGSYRGHTGVIQGSYRGHHQFNGPPTTEKQF